MRIGIGIAQGLGFGADLPMIGISTLKAMAQANYRLHGKEQVIAAIDARMSEVYLGQYQRLESGDWIAVVPECVIPPQEVGQLLDASPLAWTTGRYRLGRIRRRFKFNLSEPRSGRCPLPRCSRHGYSCEI
ncbi:inactive homolog of metal-dependent proteases putative molecular chaperone [Vibrio astriarenae]|nr:inactive homolog of metal-dependent proteases putative molecular chaperone [Vibrio sp. C7]